MEHQLLLIAFNLGRNATLCSPYQLRVFYGLELDFIFVYYPSSLCLFLHIYFMCLKKNLNGT